MGSCYCDKVTSCRDYLLFLLAYLLSGRQLLQWRRRTVWAVQSVGIYEMAWRGRIPEFDVNGEATWEEYAERIELCRQQAENGCKQNGYVAELRRTGNLLRPATVV